ncbi:MAG: hypothetical protein K6A32_00930 [Bacteroidales bacterium]|nr:hypothetical protein [Bacteroidales bacterium]
MHKSPYYLILLFWLLIPSGAVCFAQTQPRKQIKSQLISYFTNYDLGFSSKSEKCTVENVQTDDEKKILSIYVSEAFGTQPLSLQKVQRIYREVRQLLPSPYDTYQTQIYSKQVLIDDLVPGGTGTTPRQWGDIHHRGNAWVTPLDRTYDVENGLEGRHLCLWASHGRYFSLKDQNWQWQRPNLFCTNEDLLTQTFVIPYLLPMLENAGAIVYSPRERDWQRCEAIVDNDTPEQGGYYLERQGQHPWNSINVGFAPLKTVYTDRENPFLAGTARMANTQNRRAQESRISWVPQIPEDGSYAVYVSYSTLPTSIPDAHYTVHHGGQTSHFRVNQQMGGSTWVYLGTFFFNANNEKDNFVELSNRSNYRGHVTADAVRFGGGTGNIARGDSLSVSGLPRCFEAARYAVQWAGAPYEVYASKNSTNDYAEDINARSAMENYLARGSAYAPGDSGLHVPLELSIAIHSDAGTTRDNSFIGTLGVYTSDFNEGFLPAGLSRLTSRDLCDQVMTQVFDDLKGTLGTWSRRMMFDRNYSESREPIVPSMILETLSHQNFPDIRLAHDPYFKFLLSRAIYKGILRAVHNLHESGEAIVQPLPITAPAAHIHAQEREIELSWLATEDPLEPSAMPTGFIVYHATDNGDFDNGTYVRQASYRLKDATTDVLHRFRITACNEGGQSMYSQEVCAYIYDNGGPQVLVVDGFDRLAGPRPFENDSLLGFDLNNEPGVPMAKMPGYCGEQVCFNKATMGREGPGALGFSTSELEGMIIAGNTMDWTTRHARDLILATNGRINIGSCTTRAAERTIFDSRQYQLLDLVLGLQCADGYSLIQSRAFTPEVIQATASFARNGGSILVSGANIGNDLGDKESRLFAHSVLKYDYIQTLQTDSLLSLTGLNTSFEIHRVFNEKSYRVAHVDCLLPVDGAFCPMIYNPTGQSAAVAYKGADYSTISLGFPFESITDADTRVNLLRGILQFLMP